MRARIDEHPAQVQDCWKSVGHERDVRGGPGETVPELDTALPYPELKLNVEFLGFPSLSM